MKSMVQFKLTVMAASHQALPLAAIRPDPVCSERDCLRSGWNAGTLRHGPQNPTPNRSRTPAKPCNQCPCPAYRPIPNGMASCWPTTIVPRSKSKRLESKEGKIGGQGLALWLALGLLPLHSLPFHMHHCPALLPGSTHCSCSPALLHIASARLQSPLLSPLPPRSLASRFTPPAPIL